MVGAARTKEVVLGMIFLTMVRLAQREGQVRPHLPLAPCDDPAPLGTRSVMIRSMLSIREPNVNQCNAMVIGQCHWGAG